MWSLTLAIAAYGAAPAAPSCLNDQGEAVDYFYAFKFPDGYDYAYMDGDSKLASAQGSLDSTDSCVTRTLAQYFTKSFSSVFWNDQHPDGTEKGAPFGHMKGALIFNAKGGAWVTHSLPLFPDLESASSMWSAASEKYGQSYLCVTVGPQEVNAIAKAMVVQRPSVYEQTIAANLDEAYPDVVSWAGQEEHSTETSTTVEIKSVGGVAFTLFGTGAKFGADLYADLVAPAAGSLVMEGWRNGRGNMDASCTRGHYVLDATDVEIAGQDWKTSQDHSKWCLSKTHFCVGDKNRQEAQMRRGGGTVCITEKSIVTQLQKVPTSTDSCSDEQKDETTVLV
jgi:deoxyribonuclease-2